MYNHAISGEKNTISMAIFKSYAIARGYILWFWTRMQIIVRIGAHQTESHLVHNVMLASSVQRSHHECLRPWSFQGLEPHQLGGSNTPSWDNLSFRSKVKEGYSMSYQISSVSSNFISLQIHSRFGQIPPELMCVCV